MVEFCAIGTVISNDNNTAKIKIVPQSACQGNTKGCSACKGFTGKQEYIIEADNDINAKQDDKVKVQIKSPDYYKALIIVFIMPIAFLLAGYIIGLNFSKILINSEYYFAIIGFAVSFIIVKILGKRIKSKYKIIAIV